MSDWSRRRLLTTAGAALATAGCTTLETDAPADGTTSEPDEPESEGAAPAGSYADVYDRTVGSVVTVRVYDGFSNSGGSGFVRGDGIVVTNEHVVEGAERVDVAFTEGEWTTGELLGTDVYTDLAAIAVEEVPDYATSLPLATEDPPVGTRVLALGNPYQLEASASSGIVSGVDRSLSGVNRFPIPDAIQTDAAVNPGNSGGPLVKLDGEVVGVISAGGGENIGFAISAPLARRVVPELVETGSYSHAYVGVRLLTVTPRVAEGNDLDLEDPRGVLVTDVVEDGPAAGVLEESPDSTTVRGQSVPVGGDVVLSLDGSPTPTLDALTSVIALETSPGDVVDVELLRDGDRETVELELGERPSPR
jgi:serine protease Do